MNSNIDPETINTILPLVPTMAKLFINSIPKKWLKAKIFKDIDINQAVKKNLDAYLENLCKKCYYINTLVFRTQQVSLSQIYYPMTIVPLKNEGNRCTNTYVLNDIPSQITQADTRILISDLAGMGKSTLLKWISLKLLESQSKIPIIFELRRLEKNQDLKQHIKNQFVCTQTDIDDKIFIEVLKLGDFIFMFDGFDEVPRENKEYVVNQVKDFVRYYPKNSFIVTSRPENGLSAFGEFSGYSISPLKYEESLILLKKYAALCVDCGIDRLIESLDKGHKHIREFMQNPFMISLLLYTYMYNQQIPSSKSCFYEEVYFALYKNHDLSKDHFERAKFSGLNVDQFSKLAGELAFNSLKQSLVEYSESHLGDILAQSVKPGSEYNCSVDSYRYDLLHNVQLMVRDGLFIRWVHKSFLDYFAAVHICKSEKKAEIIQRLLSRDKDSYYNVLDFIRDIDYPAFKTNVIVPIVNRFISDYENAFMNPYSIDDTTITRLWEVWIAHQPYITILPVLKPTSSVKPFNIGNISKQINDDMYRHFHLDEVKKTKVILAYKDRELAHLFPLMYSTNPELFVVQEMPMKLTHPQKLSINIKKKVATRIIDDAIMSDPDVIRHITNMVLYLSNPIYHRRLYVLDYNRCCEFIRQYEDYQQNKSDDLDDL